MLSPVCTLSGHEDRVWCAKWNSDGTLLATCGSDRTVRVWRRDNDENWRCKWKFGDSHTKTIRSVDFSPCNRYIVTCSFDSTIIVWQINKENGEYELFSTLEGHENEVKSASFSPSGRYLASCSRDKSVWVWEMDEDEDFQCCSILQSHSQDVKQVKWHPKDDLLVSCSYDDSIKFYRFDGDDWTVSYSIPSAHESTVWDVAFNSQGNKLASCSDDRNIKIWRYRMENGAAIGDREKWEMICKINSDIHRQPIYSIDWCFKSDHLATGCGDNNIRLFHQTLDQGYCSDAANFELVHTVEGAHEQDVNCVRWNPKFSGLLASASDDCTVKLWQLSC